MARNYKAEAAYEDTPTQVKHRVARNKARRMLAKEGLVKKGDQKDVGHLLAMGKGGKTVRSNLAVQSVATNRSFARRSDGTMKSEQSRREIQKKR